MEIFVPVTATTSRIVPKPSNNDAEAYQVGQGQQNKEEKGT